MIATEVELKLAVRARDLPAVRRALEARAGGAEKSRRVRLRSTYFDTADQALARRGLTLRVRERDGQFIQTVKSQRLDGAGLARGEWEDRIASARPDPAAADSGHFLAPEVEAQLTPLFRTEVARREIDLAPAPGTRIEAAVDRGRINAVGSDAGEPISEVELELKSGSPTALYDVALDLLAVAPLRVEPRSKAERGYHLAATGGGQPSAVHAAPVPLDPALSGHEALRRIGLACLDQILRNEAAVLAGLPDGVHQMRVAVRRLRAILSAFGHLLPKTERRKVSSELRRLAGSLGVARNLDVFRYSMLAPAQESLGGTGGLTQLAAIVDKRRAAAYAAAAKAVRAPSHGGLMLRLARWFEGCGWRNGAASDRLDRPIGGVAARALDRLRRKVLRRAKGFAGQPHQQRHKLRIALKKLRYAVELMATLYAGEQVELLVGRLKRLQDGLGEVNDLQGARDIVAELVSPTADPALADAGAFVLRWHERRLGKHEAALRRGVERLRDGEPFWRG